MNLNYFQHYFYSLICSLFDRTFSLFMIYRSWLIVFHSTFFFLYATFSFSQNLLPDGSFEQIIYAECERPDQGFKKMQYWYLLDATPDLFEGRCAFNEADFVFWEESAEPYDGQNYAGLWSRWNSNNNYVTEGIATSLTQPLEAGKTYLFEMAIRNQGNFQGVLGGTQSSCTLEPQKHIDLYLSQDSIVIENDFATGSSSTSASLVAIMDSETIQSEGTDGWSLISTCFVAQGGEQFFAIILPLGTFGVLPSCATDSVSEGVYQSFYYHIDAVSVTEFEATNKQIITVCENQNFEVNLNDLFDYPLFQEATFIWEDGVTASQRSLSAIKNYLIDAQLTCGNFPLVLNILPENCESDLYIPNVFSPNSDGINDVFQAYFASEKNIANFQLTIFDRWGNLLFQTKQPNNGWNGISKNQAVAQGMYIWFIQFDKMELGMTTPINLSGEVLIIR